MRPAVEISYLSKDEQEMLFNSIEYSDATPSHAQAIKLRKESELNGLTEEFIENLMNEEKPNQITKIKISENSEKITNPGFKKIYRLFDKTTDVAIADIISLNDESIDENSELEIFDPVHTWKRIKVTNFYAKDLLVKIFDKGNQVYSSPSVLEIKDFSKQEVSKLWPEILRFENPHTYYVDLSSKLWNLKQELLLEKSN